ncbi:MAG TPA: hypothetical protein VF389_11845 [Woeseiaceae bacterium]
MADRDDGPELIVEPGTVGPYKAWIVRDRKGNRLGSAPTKARAMRLASDIQKERAERDA